MQRCQRVIAVGAVILATACAHHPAPADADAPVAPAAGVAADVERELASQQAAFFEAVAARDADRTSAFFADDALLHVANLPPIAGRDAIRRFYRRMFGFLAATASTPEALHVAAGGDVAYGTGSTSNEFRGAEGTARYAGKYVLVWRRVAGEWMVALYGLSSNQPETAR
jgi:ketosteroid isomerase-like protein